MKEFSVFKDEFTKRVKAFQSATSGKTKPTAQEACKLISNMSDTVTRWRKYAETKASSCGIPAEITTQLKTQQTQVATAQKNICNAAAQQAAGAAAGPPPPSLSEALGGGAMLPEAPPTNKRVGGGTFDTLNGNVLSR